MKQSRRTRAVLWSLLAIGVIVACVWVGAQRRKSDPLARLTSAARHLRVRPIEGRLGQSFPWVGRAVTRGSNETAPDLDAVRFRAVAAEVARDGSSPAIRGLGFLLAGDPGTAVMVLRSATRNSPDSAADLAAAYLELGRVRGTPLSAIDALAAVDDALVLAPDHRAARFNRAIALERLGLLHEARADWMTCRDNEPEPRWSDEAASAISRIDTELMAAESWSDAERALIAATLRGDDGEVRRIVAAFPRDARRSGEARYAVGWAKATGQNNAADAAQQLAIARSIGAALVATSGERLLADSVRVIEECNRDSERRATLVRAYSEYVMGRIAHSNDDADATVRLRRAADLFAEAGSPMQWVARYYVGSALYGRHRLTEAATVLDGLMARNLDHHGYFAVAGDVGWEGGLVHLIQGNFSTAATIFERSRALLLRINETNAAANLQVFEADVFDLIGDADRAWRTRTAALRNFARTGDRIMTAVALVSSASAMINRQEWDRAAPLLDLAVNIAAGVGDATRLASALMHRSVVRAHQQNASGTHADLRDLRVQLARIGEADVRDGLRCDALYAEAMLMRQTDPATAVERLTEAIEAVRNSGRAVYQPRLFLERARLNRLLGNTPAARNDLNSGLEIFERARGNVTDADLRVTTITAVSDLFDEAISLAITNNTPSEVLALAERERARSILETFSERTREVSRSPMTAAEISAALAENAAIVEYVVGGGQLSAIVIKGGEAPILVPLGDLAQLSDSARAAAAAVRAGKETDALANAWRSFVAPLVDHLPGISHVAFVPDRRITSLPFAALYDASRERYVIDEFTVVVAPSATLAIACSRRAKHLGHGSALSIGSDAFDTQRYPNSNPLLWVVAEARAVAAVHRGAHLLTGAEATAQRLRELLPQATVVHYAGHAIAQQYQRGDSALLTARDAAKSKLTAAEIASMSLPQTRLVVLSACRSGAPGQSGDGIENLALAFLVAGVPSVLAATWDVDDRQAGIFGARFHAEFIFDGDTARAYRDTALAMQTSGSGGRRTPPPWALITPFGGSPQLIWQGEKRQ